MKKHTHTRNDHKDPTNKLYDGNISFLINQWEFYNMNEVTKNVNPTFVNCSGM
jgi:hypothetical protein